MNEKSLLRGAGHLLLTLCLSLSAARAAGIVDELNPTQLAQLRAGQQLTITEDVTGKPWPKVKIYRIIKGSPEETAAGFFDYSHGKDYIPNILKSVISKQISPTVCEIDYGIDVPILPDEYYTVRNTLTFAEPASYKFNWKLVKAIQTKDSEGSFRCEPFDKDALVSYQNLVTPGSSMAILLRGKAISQMKDTVDAIATRVEKQRMTNPADLEREVSALRQALAAK